MGNTVTKKWVRVVDLYKLCSYDMRSTTEKRRGPAAASSCCGRAAQSVVRTPTGAEMWRCGFHEGRLDNGRRGPSSRQLEVVDAHLP